jgi:caffeoyl-CoA O-methyltransferase
MQIAPEQGQFMAMLVHLIGARRCLEIGVYTGYSALCTALALPDNGVIIACDVSEKWTSIARKYWEKAGVEHKIDLRLAPAAETLIALLQHGKNDTFDFVFIDADKKGYDFYYETCLSLLRKGGLMAIDNVLWDGTVADETIQDEDTEAIRQLNRKIFTDSRVELSMVPIADGLTLVRKL